MREGFKPRHDRYRRSRRRFLFGAGGSLLALPWLSSLSRGAAPAPIKRFVAIIYQQGEGPGFIPVGSPRTGFDLASTYNSPLVPFQDRMLLLDHSKGEDGHWEGFSEALNGFPQIYDDNPSKPPRALGGPSIDQLMAERLKTVTAYPSLELTLNEGDEDSTYTTIALRSPDMTRSIHQGVTGVPCVSSPAAVFNRVFAEAGGMGGPGAAAGGSAPSLDDEAEARLSRNKKSMLDSLLGDYTSLRDRLSPRDRHLLDLHLGLLRDQEVKLREPSIRPPALTCQTPVAPGRGDGWEERGRAFMDLIASSFACDATRVVTLSWGGGEDAAVAPPSLGRADWHSINHEDGAKPDADLFKGRVWLNQQLAYLCQQLDRIPEGEGRTVLDNTAIITLTELGNKETRSGGSGDSHGRERVSNLLLGGCGGFFNTGKYVDLQGALTQDVLLTLCHAMGLKDVTQIGQSNPRRPADGRPGTVAAARSAFGDAVNWEA